MGFTDGMSAADLAAVTRGNDDGFGGGNGAWWIIVLFLFAFGGWGGRGFGGYGNGAGGVSESYTLVSDMGQIERKIDGVYSGICDSTFALNNTINNGFAAAQNTMTQGFAGLNTGMVQQGYETRLGIQGIGSQMQSCCCDLRAQIGDVNYNIANQANGITNAVNTGFCQTNFNAVNNTRDIIDSHRNDTQAILAKLDAMENSRKDEKIAEQACAINNQYLLSQINKVPSPAYIVPSPYCNCNNNCGCA